jgi:hypothetical protein
VGKGEENVFGSKSMDAEIGLVMVSMPVESQRDLAGWLEGEFPQIKTYLMRLDKVLDSGIETFNWFHHVSAATDTRIGRTGMETGTVSKEK